MRYAFLALLARGPAHGYEIRQSLESTFGDAWPPLNYGQIYTTLGRLERDGLVVSEEVAQGDRPNKRVYQLTDAGRAELEAWMQEPAEGPEVKNAFFMKLVMAHLTGLASPSALIDRQRATYLQRLRDLDDLARRAGRDDNPAAELLIEGATLHLEADLKWLDRCEERFVSHSKQGRERR